MHDPTTFTDTENWTGGFYELPLELGASDDERLQRAVTALWRAAAITGRYGSKDRDPTDQNDGRDISSPTTGFVMYTPANRGWSQPVHSLSKLALSENLLRLCDTVGDRKGRLFLSRWLAEVDAWNCLLTCRGGAGAPSS